MTEANPNPHSPKSRIPRKYSFNETAKPFKTLSQSTSRAYIPIALPRSSKNSFITPDSSATTSAGLTPKHRASFHQKSESLSSNLSFSELKCNSPVKYEYSALNYSQTKASAYTSELTKKDSIIVDLNLRLHEKNILIKNLKEQLSNGELKEIKKKLEEKEAECERLKEQLNTNQKECIEKLEKETQRLLNLLKEGDNKLEALKKEIESLNEINSKLQTKQGSMVKAISNYNKEMKIMKVLKYRNITYEEMHKIEKQFTEIEEIQNKLIQENSELKLQLAQMKLEKECSGRGEARDLASELFKIMLELTQLVRVVSIMHTGQRVDLSIILCVAQQIQEVTGEPLDQCKEITAIIRKDLSELRSIISDAYAEHCGEKCTTQ
ncbi:unnamed protein product [Blepharisma stoltei]|uniref:Uncharacterized protein n=1 Tax=Blepharisma stoltei TaxID=1481888 RepID=A0AAU9J0K4_9CILI|nr:unnamed protein product [Blepharisma stoltei]